MTADPYEPISEITETKGIPLRESASEFFYAVLIGTLAGGSPLLILAVPVGIGVALDGAILWGFYFAALPLLIAATVTFFGMTMIGLPLTALLAHLDSEKREIYVLAGVLTGGLFGLALAFRTFGGDLIGAILIALGVFAGASTSFVWSNWRQRRSSTRRKTRGERSAPDSQPRNPFHDMMY